MSSLLEFLGILFVCILIALVISWMCFITDSVDKLQDRVDKLQNQVNNNAKINNNNYDEYEDRLDKLEKKSKI